jgi:hypothetical protein
MADDSGMFRTWDGRTASPASHALTVSVNGTTANSDTCCYTQRYQTDKPITLTGGQSVVDRRPSCR